MFLFELVTYHNYGLTSSMSVIIGDVWILSLFLCFSNSHVLCNFPLYALVWSDYHQFVKPHHLNSILTSEDKLKEDLQWKFPRTTLNSIHPSTRTEGRELIGTPKLYYFIVNSLLQECSCHDSDCWTPCQCTYSVPLPLPSPRRLLLEHLPMDFTHLHNAVPIPLRQWELELCQPSNSSRD